MYLSEYIEKIIRDNETNRTEGYTTRDVEVVKTFMGLGSIYHPKLETVAEEFDLNDREHTRQIIKNKFRDNIDLQNDFYINRIIEVIKSKDIHFDDELLLILNELEILSENASIIGLVSFFIKSKVINDYKIYNLDLKIATKNDFINRETFIIVRTSVRDILYDELKVISTTPGKIGIPNLKDVLIKKDLTETYFETYKRIIAENTRRWNYIIMNGESWFLKKDRSNIIHNSLKKIVNVTTVVDIEILANVIHNTINQRTNNLTIPTEEIILEYLKICKFISIHGSVAKINIESKKLELIEINTIDCFREHGSLSMRFSTLRKLMMKKGHSSKNLHQKISHYPFIYVDKSNGHQNYTYNLVSQYQDYNSKVDAYSTCMIQLEELSGDTDIDIIGKARKEQKILRKWLFDNQTSAKCAICGKEYSLKSLVCAHKKKRSECSNEERVDPNIVMPLCLFGCDYLYEHNFIYINSGSVETSFNNDLEKAENEYLHKLIGRTLDEKWLKGSSQYFNYHKIKSND